MSEPTTNALEKARRVLPVLIYYASILRRTLTYGDLGEITGDHHRSFRPAFAVIHRWIKESSIQHGIEELPLAIIVVQQGKELPGPGAIRWRLERNGLSTDSSPEVIVALLREEQRKIFSFGDWAKVLKDRGLHSYRATKTDIEEITKELVQGRYGGGGESEGHRRLKHFVSLNPTSVGLPVGCKLCGTEVVLPSLDRVDVLFQYGEILFPLEVKSIDANELEITRGIYQTVKYQALFTALQKDKGLVPLVETRLILEGKMNTETRRRSESLDVRVMENVAPVLSS